MKHFPAATRLLRRRLGARVVRTAADALAAASFDASKLAFLPEAVVFPRHDADLAATLALANEHRVPVTVRGRGTSLTGSAAPRRGVTTRPTRRRRSCRGGSPWALSRP